MGNDIEDRAKEMTQIRSGVRIEGVENVLRNLKRFENDVLQRKLLLRSLRLAVRKSNIINVAVQKTPRSDKPHKRSSGNATITYNPGNLQKSIGMITGKNRAYPNIQVGYQAGLKRKNDGFYGLFVDQGYGRGNRTGTEAMEEAFRMTRPMFDRFFINESRKVMERRKKKYGFR